MKRRAWVVAFAAVWVYLPGAVGDVPSFSIGPYLQNVTENSIIVCWESDVPTDGRLESWVEGTQTSSIVSVPSDERHEFLLGNLQPGTAYRYRVRIPAEGEGTFFAAGFRTAPTEDVPFTFVVYGDTRTNGPEHQSVVEAITAVKPTFVVHTGDLVSRGDSDNHWNAFWEIVAPSGGEESLGGNSPMYPLLGNHEYYSTSEGYKDEADLKYQTYFVLPPHGLEAEHPEWLDRFYSFRYGPVFCIILDSNNDSDPEYDLNTTITEGPPDIHPGSPQHEWLRNQLKVARAECPFTFVCLHHSAYSTGPYGRGASKKMRFLDPLFREYGVDAVFSSHDHIYERCETYVDNYRVLYFVEGAGGAPLYSRASGWDVPGSWMWDELNQTYYTKAFDNSSHSFIKVEMVPLGGGVWQATLSATRPDGEVFDLVRIIRPRAQVSLADTLTFWFETTPGQIYQAEYSNDLPGSEMEWRPLGSPILADGPLIRIIDDGTETGTRPTDATVRRRFYRAYELP